MNVSINYSRGGGRLGEAGTVAETKAEGGGVAGGGGGGADIGWFCVGRGQVGESGLGGKCDAVVGVGQGWPGYTFVGERSCQSALALFICF